MWQERTAVLLPAGVRAAEGVGPALALRPGFARVAVELDVTAFGGGSGLRVWLQHSADGEHWRDCAAFAAVTAVGAQVAWLEAQPALAGAVTPTGDGLLAAGSVHAGFLHPRFRARWTLGGSVAHTFGLHLTAVYG
jgi:hypothetical protein